MIAKKNDIPFLIIVTVLSALVSLALGSTDTKVELYGVAGLLGIVLVLAVIVKPDFGANVLIFAIYSNVSAQLSDHGYPGIIKPLVAVVFGAILIRNYYAGQLPTQRRSTLFTEIFLALYLIVLAASYAVADNKERAITETFDYIKDIVILYVILFSLRDWQSWRRAVWVLIIVTAVLSILGVYQIAVGTTTQEFFRFSTVEIQGVFDGDQNGTSRIGGPVHDPNLWAQILVAVIAILLFRIIHEPDPLIKLFSIGLVTPMLIVLLDTYSRGGYLALMVVVALLLFVYETRKINPARIAMIVGALIIIIPFIPAGYVARFESLNLLSSDSAGNSSVYQDSSLRQRSSLMRTAALMFSRNPLLGVGAGNFRNNYQKYNEILGLELEIGEVEAHSLYLQVLSETGLLGAIAFLGIIVTTIYSMSKMMKSMDSSAIARLNISWLASLHLAIIGYLVAATFLHNVYIRYFWILIALSLSGMQVAEEQLRDLQKKETISGIIN
ncbi:MAG: O-antigen ligase family protein [Anaerolineales bacterium]|nr:O-antigen ligase family protein [Anaerolineales bacterium]